MSESGSVCQDVAIKLSARVLPSQGPAGIGESASKIIHITIGRPQFLVGCCCLATWPSL